MSGMTAIEAKPSTITGPLILYPSRASFYAVRNNGLYGLSFPYEQVPS